MTTTSESLIIASGRETARQKARALIAAWRERRPVRRIEARRRELAAERAAQANAATMAARYSPSIPSTVPDWFITGADLD